jgi:hypothetical protein
MPSQLRNGAAINREASSSNMQSQQQQQQPNCSTITEDATENNGNEDETPIPSFYAEELEAKYQKIVEDVREELEEEVTNLKATLVQLELKHRKEMTAAKESARTMTNGALERVLSRQENVLRFAKKFFQQNAKTRVIRGYNDVHRLNMSQQQQNRRGSMLAFQVGGANGYHDPLVRRPPGTLFASTAVASELGSGRFSGMNGTLSQRRSRFAAVESAEDSPLLAARMNNARRSSIVHMPQALSNEEQQQLNGSNGNIKVASRRGSITDMSQQQQLAYDKLQRTDSLGSTSHLASTNHLLSFKNSESGVTSDFLPSDSNYPAAARRLPMAAAPAPRRRGSFAMVTPEQLKALNAHVSTVVNTGADPNAVAKQVAPMNSGRRGSIRPE